MLQLPVQLLDQLLILYQTLLRQFQLLARDLLALFRLSKLVPKNLILRKFLLHMSDLAVMPLLRSHLFHDLVGLELADVLEETEDFLLAIWVLMLKRRDVYHVCRRSPRLVLSVTSTLNNSLNPIAHLLVPRGAKLLLILLEILLRSAEVSLTRADLTLELEADLLPHGIFHLEVVVFQGA